MKSIYLMAGMLFLAINCFGNDEVNGWSYKYDIKAKGKRSEEVCNGKLTYKGEGLSLECGDVITPIGEFVFIDGAGLGTGVKIGWVPCGKLPGYSEGTISSAHTEKEVEMLLSGKIPDFRKSAIKETPSTSAQPYIEGTFENPPKGVGVDWFYAVKQGLWVNPKKIDEVLKTKLAKSTTLQSQ